MAAWKEEIRRRLEEQAGQIEDVLNRYRMSAVVTGGVVYSRVFEFTIQGSTRRVSNQLASVQAELVAVLSVPAVEIACQDEQMTVRVTQWHSYPLQLREVMKSVGEIKPMTAVLGAIEDGRSLLLHLPTAEIDNILVVGGRAAGKSSLLRALLYSLAARNKQHQFQAAVIDYDPTARSEELDDGPLAAFNHLPHLVEPIATTLKRAIQVLDFLVEEVNYRLEKEVASPKILLVIDNLDSLLAAGQQPLLSRLLFLLQNGAEVGIHLVLALEKPEGPFTNEVLKCGFSLRFVGRVRNGSIARAAAGIFNTGAEHLQGQGDFVAVKDGQNFRFQTAYISDFDLYLAVDELTRQAQKKLVVRTAGFQPRLAIHSSEFP